MAARPMASLASSRRLVTSTTACFPTRLSSTSTPPLLSHKMACRMAIRHLPSISLFSQVRSCLKSDHTMPACLDLHHLKHKETRPRERKLQTSRPSPIRKQDNNSRLAQIRIAIYNNLAQVMPHLLRQCRINHSANLLAWPTPHPTNSRRIKTISTR